jgi:hypothetical protein
MIATKPKSNFEDFEKVVQRYEQYLGRNLTKKENYSRQIDGILPICVEYFSHFGIRDLKKNRFIIEFYVENGNDTPLYTAIKRKEYWEKVHIFDKKVKYDPNNRIGGTILIECDYSTGVENICAYISEFIYQIKGRIENMIGGPK